jgi:hypothetical protein
MYKKALIIKLIDAIICEFEKKHDLFFFEISIDRKVRQCSLISQKDLNEDDFLKLTFAIKTLSTQNNQLKKIDKIKIIQKNASKIVQCDTCAISKMHRLIQQTSSTKAIKFF